MDGSILKLQSCTGINHTVTYRTIIKNRHGRVVYLELSVSGGTCTVTDCFYLDRCQCGTVEERRKFKPKLLKTLQFPKEDLLGVIAEQLDRKYFGVEYINDNTAELSLEDYLKEGSDSENRKYRFLIMIGEGSESDGLPVRLRTRLKNKLHRSVYVELEYYRDGKGVVRECYYYDRAYKRKGIKITPRQLVSCFFPYSKEGIIDLVNNEICCNFNHIIVTDGIGIDIDSDDTPICGAI